MATARKLWEMFVVAVLVASLCGADVVEGVVHARTVRVTKMQEQPGTGDFVFAPLKANAFLIVECRVQSSVIINDPWWLKVHAIPAGTGYVPDFDVKCDDAPPASQCPSVPHC